MKNFLKKINFFLIIIFAFSFSSPILTVNATLQDDLAAVQQKLKDIKNQKNTIQQSLNKDKSLQNQYSVEIMNLKNQIDLLDTEIKEKDLIIQELNLQIQILTQTIETTTNEISTAKDEIVKLEDETDKRLVDIYISEKTFSQLDMFLNEQGGDIIKLSVYQKSFQMETNKLLDELNQKKIDLEKKQKQLETDKAQIILDQTTLETEKVALTKKQTELDGQRAVFYKKRNELTASIQQNSDLINIYSQEEQKTLHFKTKLNKNFLIMSLTLGTELM